MRTLLARKRKAWDRARQQAKRITLDEPFLPMPYADAIHDKRGADEYFLYRERHAGTTGSLRLHPLLNAKARAKAWGLLVRHVPGLTWQSLASAYPSRDVLEPEELADLETATQQAAVLSVLLFINCGRAERKPTFPRLVELLAERFSEHYGHAITTGPATCWFELSEADKKHTSRDLRNNGIELGLLWDLVTQRLPNVSGPRFYRIVAALVDPAQKKKTRTGGGMYSVKGLDDAPGLADDFEQTVRQDEKACPAPPYPYTLRLAEDRPSEPLPTKPRQHVVNGWAYNVVQMDAMRAEMAQVQSQIELEFCLSAFREDYELAEKRKGEAASDLLEFGVRAEELPLVDSQYRLRLACMEHPADPSRVPDWLTQWPTIKSRKQRLARREDIGLALERYDLSRAITTAFKGIYTDKRLADKWHSASACYVRIYSDYRVELNHRWQAADFSPAAVTAKTLHRNLYGGPETQKAKGLRARWFRFPADPALGTEPRALKGLDVSASQAQMQAVFLGLKDLELATKRDTYWQDKAALLLPRMAEGAYKGAGDPQLCARVKNHDTRRFYGSAPHLIASDQYREQDAFGLGFAETEWKGQKSQTLKWEEECPGGRGRLLFLTACERMAEAAYALDLRAGLEIACPGGTVMRWNNPKVTLRSFGFNTHHPSVEGEKKKRRPFTFSTPVQGERKITSEGGAMRKAFYSTRPLPVEAIPGETTWKFRRRREKVKAQRKAAWRAIAKRHDRECKKVGAPRYYEFIPAQPDDQGRYPVSKRTLKQMASPCLTHATDGDFSTLVMEEMHKRGMPMIGIHDCWETADRVVDRGIVRDGQRVLQELLGQFEESRDTSLGEMWLRNLGPYYETLIRYLRHAPLWACPLSRCQKTAKVIRKHAKVLAKCRASLPSGGRLRIMGPKKTVLGIKGPMQLGQDYGKSDAGLRPEIPYGPFTDEAECRCDAQRLRAFFPQQGWPARGPVREVSWLEYAFLTRQQWAERVRQQDWPWFKAKAEA